MNFTPLLCIDDLSISMQIVDCGLISCAYLFGKCDNLLCLHYKLRHADMRRSALTMCIIVLNETLDQQLVSITFPS